MNYSKEKVDEAVLALLWLTSYSDGPTTRAWKGHDWDAFDRLHQQGLIGNPRSKAKSVSLSEEGAEKAKQLFQKMFGE
jgi:hypothetical protein